MTRILVLANKSWETAPLVAAFQNDEARPHGFPAFQKPPQVDVPLSNGSSTKTVAARLALSTANATAEVWCIQDLMDLPAKSSSSSEEKARVLPYVAANGASPSLVVAFGTAAIADARSYNGCVVVGSNVFVHNPRAANPNPRSRWTHPDIGKLRDSSGQALNLLLFDQLGRNRPSVEARFLRPTLNPADSPTLLLSPAYVALSNVNITDYSEYVWADQEALRAFATAEPKQSVGSVETTHGVIRLAVASQQFLFVSGIANRLGYFNMETAPRSYAQNFSASHNAGVALAWMMPILMA